MANQYWVANGAIPTTASQVAVACTTNIQTLLELATPATTEAIIKAWGISFDASAAAVPGIIELFGTTVTVGAGGTAVVAHKYGNPGGVAAAVTCKFSPTGSPLTEGTVANYRAFDVQHVAPTNQYVYQWPLGCEPRAAVSTFVRVRVKFAAAVNAICWIQWEE
jgi:hypothetical protein